MRLIAFLVMAFASAAASAEPILARADALQPPVWVERNGTRAALRPGAPILAGDEIITGVSGRLHIAMEDASTVKLGEGARFQLPALAIVDNGSQGGLFKGALKVLKGAFRFTTSALGKLRPREVDVYIGPTITAGIRGTDIWGKSEDSQELLCLLEGRIEISSPGAQPQVMDQANTFYSVPRDQAPLPVAPAPASRIASWAPQTELDADAAAQMAGGRYGLVLASVATQAQAQSQASRLSDEGYGVDVRPVSTAKGARYRLVLPGFASHAEAARFARAHAAALGFGNAWVLPPA
jgi:hypothetical protein